MSVQPAALELLGALAGVLDRWGRWYLFGAQAVVAYGAPRFSADVDVTVRLDPDDPARFVRDMEAAGFALRVDDPDFVRRTRVMPFAHVATGMPLDVVLAGSGLEDEFIERAKTTDIGGARVPLIDVADLIVGKVPGRPPEGRGGRPEPLASPRIRRASPPRPPIAEAAGRRPRPERPADRLRVHRRQDAVEPVVMAAHPAAHVQREPHGHRLVAREAETRPLEELFLDARSSVFFRWPVLTAPAGRWLPAAGRRGGRGRALRRTPSPPPRRCLA